MPPAGARAQTPFPQPAAPLPGSPGALQPPHTWRRALRPRAQRLTPAGDLLGFVPGSGPGNHSLCHCPRHTPTSAAGAPRRGFPRCEGACVRRPPSPASPARAIPRRRREQRTTCTPPGTGSSLPITPPGTPKRLWITGGSRVPRAPRGSSSVSGPSPRARHPEARSGRRRRRRALTGGRGAHASSGGGGKSRRSRGSSRARGAAPRSRVARAIRPGAAGPAGPLRATAPYSLRSAPAPPPAPFVLNSPRRAATAAARLGEVERELRAGSGPGARRPPS